MAKPLQPHASFCSCAECTHRALHPQPTNLDTAPEIPSDDLVIETEPCVVCGELHGDELTADQFAAHAENQSFVTGNDSGAV